MRLQAQGEQLGMGRAVMVLFEFQAGVLGMAHFRSEPQLLAFFDDKRSQLIDRKDLRELIKDAVFSLTSRIEDG